MLNDKYRNQFDELLEQIIANLPDNLQQLMEEVPLIIEDEPSDELLAKMKLNRRHTELCGLHWGVALTHRSVQAITKMPDHMMLFRGPILRLTGVIGARSGKRMVSKYRDRGLKQQIKVTLLHEIGHHFGLDESQLRELGYG